MSDQIINIQEDLEDPIIDEIDLLSDFKRPFRSTSPIKGRFRKKDILNFQKEKNNEPSDQMYFDNNPYEFVDPNNLDYYRNFNRKFMEEKQKVPEKVFKNRMFHLITDLTYDMILKDLGEAQSKDILGELPQKMKFNKILFAKMMVKSKRLQQFFNHFSESLKEIMKHELNLNRNQVDLYLQQLPKKGIQDSMKDFHPSMKQQEKYEFDQQIKKVERSRQNYNYHKESLKQQKKVQGIEEAKKKRQVEVIDAHKKQEPKYVFIPPPPEQFEKLAKALEENSPNNKKVKFSVQNLQEQIQNRRAETQEQRQKNKNKLLQTQFQKTVGESASRIESLLNQVSDNNIDLKNDVEKVEEELQQLHQEKVSISPLKYSRTRSLVPGQEIEKLMADWGQQEYYSDQMLSNYASELWLSLEKFEQQLRNEATGEKIQYEEKIKRLNIRIERLKNVTCDQIQALEMALRKTKMKKNAEIEQASMYAAELESKLLRLIVPAEKVDALVNKVDSGLFLKNTSEARQIIQQMSSSIKSKHHEMMHYQRLFGIMDGANKQKNQMLYQMEQDVENVKEQRDFYKNLMMEMIKGLDLFQNQPEFKFKLIDINIDARQYQEQVKLQEHLQDMNISSRILQHIDNFQSIMNNADKLMKNLIEWDVIQVKKRPDRHSTLTNIHTFNELESVKSGFDKNGLSKERQEELMSIFTAQGLNLNNEGKKFGQPKEVESPLAQKGGLTISKQNSQVKVDSKHVKRTSSQMLSKSSFNFKNQVNESKKFIKQKTIQEIKLQMEKIKSDRNLSIQEKETQNEIEKPIPEEDEVPKEKSENRKKEKISDLQVNVKVNHTPDILKESKKSSSQQDLKDESKKDKEGNSADKEQEKQKQQTSNDKSLKDPQTHHSKTDKSPTILDKELSSIKSISSKSQSSQSISSGKSLSLKKNSTFKKMAKMKINLDKSNISKTFQKESRKEPYSMKKMMQSEDNRQADSDSRSITPSSPTKTPEKSKRKLTYQKSTVSKSKGKNSPLKSNTMKSINSSFRGKLKDMVQNKLPSKNSKRTIITGVTNKEGQEGDEECQQCKLPEIVQIHQNIKKLFDQKFAKKIESLANKMEEQEENYGEYFKMKATVVKDFQDLVQTSLNEKLTMDQYMDLFQPKFYDYFVKVNQLLKSKFELEEIIKFLEADHSKSDVAPPKKEPKGINLMNMLSPIYTMNGSLKGLHLREDMASLLFTSDDYSFTKLKRVIRTCFQMNRIIRDGLSQDFNLVSVQVQELKKEDFVQEKEPSEKPISLSKSSSKQSTVSIKNSEKTDYNTLYNTQVKQNEKYEEILELFIQHAVKIECRMVPQTKNQVSKFYEGITINSLMVKVQDGIKGSSDDLKDLSFYDYLVKVFGFIEEKIQFQQSIKLHDIFNPGSKESKSNSQTEISFILKDAFGARDDKLTPRRRQEAQRAKQELMKDTGCQTIIKAMDNDKEIDPKKISKAKPKTMKALFDTVMVQEMQKTLKIFDEFALTCDDMEKRIYRERIDSNLKKDEAAKFNDDAYQSSKLKPQENQEEDLWGEMATDQQIEKRFDQFNERIRKSMFQIRKTFQYHRDQARLRATMRSTDFEKPMNHDLQVIGFSDFKIKQGLVTPNEQINQLGQSQYPNFNKTTIQVQSDQGSIERKNLPNLTPQQSARGVNSMFKAKPQNINNKSNDISLKVTQIKNQKPQEKETKQTAKISNQIDFDITPNFPKLGRVEKVDTALEMLAGVSTPNTIFNSSTNKRYQTYDTEDLSTQFQQTKIVPETSASLNRNEDIKIENNFKIERKNSVKYKTSEKFYNLPTFTDANNNDDVIQLHQIQNEDLHVPKKIQKKLVKKSGSKEKKTAQKTFKISTVKNIQGHTTTMHTLNELNDKINNMSFEIQRSQKKTTNTFSETAYAFRKSKFTSAQNSPQSSLRHSKVNLNRIINSPNAINSNFSKTRRQLNADNFFEQRMSSDLKMLKLHPSQVTRMPVINSSLNTNQQIPNRDLQPQKVNSPDQSTDTFDGVQNMSYQIMSQSKIEKDYQPWQTSDCISKNDDLNYVDSATASNKYFGDNRDKFIIKRKSRNNDNQFSRTTTNMVKFKSNAVMNSKFDHLNNKELQ